MSSHIHLIISAKENNLSDVLGDFKKFTSKKLTDTILLNPGESRKKWMISIFKEAGELNSRNTNYQCVTGRRCKSYLGVEYSFIYIKHINK